MSSSPLRRRPVVLPFILFTLSLQPPSSSLLYLSQRCADNKSFPSFLSSEVGTGRGCVVVGFLSAAFYHTCARLSGLQEGPSGGRDRRIYKVGYRLCMSIVFVYFLEAMSVARRREARHMRGEGNSVRGWRDLLRRAWHQWTAQVGSCRGSRFYVCTPYISRERERRIDIWLYMWLSCLPLSLALG